MNYYGQLDLTKLGQIIAAHPERIKKVQFKDGEHQLLDIDFRTKDPDQYGNKAYIKASIRNADKVEGVNYFVADLKESQYGNEPQAQVVTGNPALNAFNQAFGTNVQAQAQNPVKTKVNGVQTDLTF